MIKDKVQMDQGFITKMTIKGHAKSNEHGKDLVCAGVSSICVGMLNALDELCHDQFDCKYSDGYIQVETSSQTHDIQLLLKTLLIQLQTVEFVHKQFIKITKQEV